MGLMFLGQLQAQWVKTIGEYTLSYADISLSVTASAISDEDISIDIRVRASKETTDMAICADNDDIRKLSETMIQMRDKYIEWVEVAKNNNVTSLVKQIDILFPEIYAMWIYSGSTDVYSDFSLVLNPLFIISNGNYRISISADVTDESNAQIEEKIYWIFSSVEDFNGLIKLLDYDKIKAKVNEGDLFK